MTRWKHSLAIKPPASWPASGEAVVARLKTLPPEVRKADDGLSASLDDFIAEVLPENIKVVYQPRGS